MVNLKGLEKQFIFAHIKEGGVAVDFTMGNGNDTLFLSKAVGPNGKVYAFDIQEQAIINTQKLLSENSPYNNCTLILDSHSNAANYVKEKICAGVFNLGYLPRGDKSITTKRDTTLAAIDFAINALDDDGIVLIAVYPGHEEGAIEGELIEKALAPLNRKIYCVSKFQIINSTDSPYFFAVEKK